MSMLLLIAAVASTLQAGIDAHGRGDFATARAALAPLAARGSPVAETLLGGMAARGQGIEPNHATAAAWWLRAAQRGYGPAQLALARALAEGRGVSRDVGQAWLWARRAEKAGGEVGRQAGEFVQEMGRKLTESDRKRLENSADGWQSWP
ncbi:hypothetical protein [Polymorphobacter sp.]|uniref:hypothetical protein n=1 Tax=Polymorphobacter sp. TaxID=1909290 RepID=UPI003F6E6699